MDLCPAVFAAGKDMSVQRQTMLLYRFRGDCQAVTGKFLQRKNTAFPFRGGIIGAAGGHTGNDLSGKERDPMGKNTETRGRGRNGQGQEKEQQSGQDQRKGEHCGG